MVNSSRELLELLRSRNGELIVPEYEFETVFPPAIAKQADQDGLIAYAGDGAQGVFDGYRLTRKGWRALGVEPPPSVIERFVSFFRKAA